MTYSSEAGATKLKNLWLLLPGLLALAIIGFCVYYLSSTHTQLQRDYLRIVHCMYRQPLWEEGFFNQQTKNAGNVFASVGIGLAATLVIWSWTLRKRRLAYHIAVKTFVFRHKYYLLPLIIITVVLWSWGAFTSVPAYDEVFSAVNCANVRPLQTLAYYMLPNNHVFFNLVNNLVFHPVYDKVLTGRIISGLSQIVLAAVLYWWLFKKLNSRIYALLYTTLLLLQFPVWGFSFQARGYALYLLCAFISLIGTEQYFTNRNSTWLIFQAAATIVGFCIMPSFLFWYSGIVCFAILYCASRRRIDMSFFKAQLFAGICIYCFYLPGICYSGLSAFVDNPYVKVFDISWTEFWGGFQRDINSTIQYSFGGNVDAHSNLYTVLFYLPLFATPFLHRGRTGTVLSLNLIIWIVFALLQFKFRHYPFMRNMIAHVSIGLCALLLCMHVLLEWLQKKLRISFLLPVGAIAFCLIIGIHFVRFMGGHVHDSLYFYDAKMGYDLPMNTIQRIPLNADVWCSDQSFYLQYLLKRRGTDASHCMGEHQEYFITDRNEGVPPVPGAINILRVDSVLQYLIYRK